MDIVSHGRRNRPVDRAVAMQKTLAGEFYTDDEYVEVTAATFRAFMSGVQVALVRHFEQIGIEFGCELRANVVDSVRVHGRTFLNGLTDTALYTPAAT